MEALESTVWQSFIKHIGSLPSTSPVPRLMFSYLQKDLVRREVSIYIKEHTVNFNHKTLDLSKRKKICKIFEVFLKQELYQITRSALIKHVYSDARSERSVRQQSCYNHNVVKLVSRARHLASKAFGEDEATAKFHWFPYDPSSGTWRLYAIKDEPVSLVKNNDFTC